MRRGTETDEEGERGEKEGDDKEMHQDQQGGKWRKGWRRVPSKAKPQASFTAEIADLFKEADSESADPFDRMCRLWSANDSIDDFNGILAKGRPLAAVSTASDFDMGPQLEPHETEALVASIADCRSKEPWLASVWGSEVSGTLGPRWLRGPCCARALRKPK